MYTRAPWAQQGPAGASSVNSSGAAGAMLPPPPRRRPPQASAGHLPRPGAPMTTRPPPRMGPQRAAAADDQTASGFAFAQTGWDSYFDQMRTLCVTSGVTSGGDTAEGSEQHTNQATFCVYTAGPLPEQQAEGCPSRRLDASVIPVYVLLHGGGLSSLSWALVAGILKRHGRPTLAYDFRAHGGSTGDESELTADQLCSDTIAVIKAMVGNETPLVIVGHSLGGAIAAKVSCTPDIRDRVIAVGMVDIVESVAMNSLDRMEEMIARRPVSFRTHDEAIQWAIKTGMVSNPISAVVSVPSFLAQEAEPERATGQTAETDAERLSWRTDLRATAPLWPDWFQGMDSAFLSCGISLDDERAVRTTRRLLLLNSLDSLGKELTVAQMQGKIQVEPLSGRGHHLHEEDPHKVGEMLLALC